MEGLKSQEFVRKYYDRGVKNMKEAKKVVEKKDWILYKDFKDGGKIYYRSVKGSSLYMYNGEVLIKDTTPEEFFNFFFEPVKKHDIDLMRKAVPNTKDLKVLQEYEEDRFYSMHMIVTSNSRMVSDRDFFVIRMIEKTEDRITILTESVEEKDEKLLVGKKSDVRGRLYYVLDIFKDGEFT